MGSGSTAIACINTKRNFVGFEIDKHYWEISNKRITEQAATPVPHLEGELCESD
jgi:DNA modification methylase